LGALIVEWTASRFLLRLRRRERNRAPGNAIAAGLRGSNPSYMARFDARFPPIAGLCHNLLLHRLPGDRVIRQEEDNLCYALSYINISSKISIIEPCQQCMIFFLPAEPKPPIAGTHNIAENLLHRCKVILSWLLQKMTHIANRKCKIGMSIHQTPQASDDASICCSVH
jgi:hypothetical protein